MVRGGLVKRRKTFSIFVTLFVMLGCANVTDQQRATEVDMSGVWKVLPDGTLLAFYKKGTASKYIEPKKLPDGGEITGGQLSIDEYILSKGRRSAEREKPIWTHKLECYDHNKGTPMEAKLELWDATIEEETAYVLFTKTPFVYMEVLKRGTDDSWKETASLRFRREAQGTGEIVESGKLVLLKSGVFAVLEFECADYTEIWQVYPEPPKRLWKSSP
jgi:hypothetical protein